MTLHDNAGYKNWLKACFSLNHLKEGLLDFVDAEVKQFHESIKTKLFSADTCNSCSTEKVIKKHRCPNKICDLIWQEIEQNHRFYSPFWQNTDATKWCTDYWEIGKCYMPRGYATKSTVTETDCAGLLNICINGTFLPSTIANQIVKPKQRVAGAPTDIFSKNRDARNTLLHSASMSITDTERRDYIDDMIKLLTNYKAPVDGVTQAAIDKLNQVNAVDIDIVPARERSLLQTKLEAMTIRQTELEERCTESEQHKEDIQNNAASYVALSQRLDKLHEDSGEDITEMQRECKSLQDRNERLHKRLLKVEDRLDSVETELDTIKKVVRKHEPEVVGKHEPGIKDVQDFLTKKYKQDLLKVPISPILRTHGVKVDEIYTELIIKDDHVHQVKRRTEDEPHTQRRHAMSGSYEDVLYDGEICCKNIYVVGKAGIGKTTWSRRLVDTWIKAITNRDMQWKPTENERLLGKYDLVFNIALRHAGADCHIMKMIEHQLFPDHPDLLTTAQTLLNEPDTSSRCIIILDGLDEWSIPVDDFSSDGIPIRDPTWECSTITTTRSWKLEELQLDTDRIDRAVKIHGLTEDGTNRLTNHVVSGLNKSTGQNKIVSDFRSQISKSVKACMEIPLLLTILVCLWHDGVQINERLAGTFTELIHTLIRCTEGDRKKRLLPKLSTEQLVEMKREWGTEKHSHPECLSDKKLFVTYLPFLLRLGELAFNRLFSEDMESTLVFDYRIIEKIMSENELELSVKVGILSRTTYPGKTLEQRFCLSFLHKMVQEYLAALYMVSGNNKLECLNIFKTYCKKEHDVRKMENVLLFISGLCPETAGEIACYISDIDMYTGKNTHQLHQLLMRCWRESRVLFNTSTPINIKQHFLYTKSDWRSGSEYNEDTLCYLRQETDKNTSLSMSNISYRDVAFGQAKETGTELLDLTGCQSLKTLHSTHSTVQILVPSSLEEVTMHEYTGSIDWKLNLSGCQSLRTLHYTDSSVEVQVSNSLEKIKIERYTGSTEWVLDLSGCQSLRTLNYTDSSVQILVPNSLEDLNIDRYTGYTDWKLDLSGCESLRTLDYIDSAVQIRIPNSLENVTISGYRGSTESVLDLSGCQSLRTLHYIDSSVHILVPNSSLQAVTICRYTGYTDWKLDLSRCRSLRTLHYIDSSVRILVPNSLEDVYVGGYRGSTEWLLDLSECKSLKTLRYWKSNPRLLVSSSLEKVDIDGYRDSTEGMLDLSGCQSLRTLDYCHSSVRIRVPNNLEKVRFNEYTGSTEWRLDLSGCQTLKTLHCRHSSVWILVPNSLEEVDIKGYTGSTDWVLDLSDCQSLNTLSQENCDVQILLPDNFCGIVF